MPAQARFGKMLRILVSDDLYDWIRSGSKQRGLSISAVSRETLQAAKNAAEQQAAQQREGAA